MAKILKHVDSYKPTMHDQYPDNVVTVHSYGESRTGGRFNENVIVGMTGYLSEYLSTPFTKADVDEIEEMMVPHFGGHKNAFNRKIFDHVVNKHGGYMPLQIDAVAEGTIMAPGLPCFTVHNTDSVCRALTTYIETSLLPGIWYPSTVATIAWRIRNIIMGFMDKSCDNLGGLQFKLHDFGVRGASSFETAEIGGTAHLNIFAGTDNVPALFYAKKHYKSICAGFTIPAMEHSTVTSWRRLGECDAYMNMLRNHKGAGLIAVVSDSYDIFEATANLWGGKLMPEVVASGCGVVIRSDSGDPVDIIPTLLNILESKYGSTVNSKNYKVLNHGVRVLQSDGIDEDVIGEILTAVLAAGFSADNVGFGMGGALLQHCDRDWGRWAMKCSEVTTDTGDAYGVAKDPITDQGKKSKEGRFSVYYHDQQKKIVCKPLTAQNAALNMLRPVYRNGEILVRSTLDENRRRINSYQ